jgi:hypothetical protein
VVTFLKLIRAGSPGRRRDIQHIHHNRFLLLQCDCTTKEFIQAPPRLESRLKNSRRRKVPSWDAVFIVHIPDPYIFVIDRDVKSLFKCDAEETFHGIEDTVVRTLLSSK